jgi:hypothetical protein
MTPAQTQCRTCGATLDPSTHFEWGGASFCKTHYVELVGRHGSTPQESIVEEVLAANPLRPETTPRAGGPSAVDAADGSAPAGLTNRQVIEICRWIGVFVIGALYVSITGPSVFAAVAKNSLVGGIIGGLLGTGVGKLITSVRRDPAIDARRQLRKAECQVCGMSPPNHAAWCREHRK